MVMWRHCPNWLVAGVVVHGVFCVLAALSTIKRQVMRQSRARPEVAWQGEDQKARRTAHCPQASRRADMAMMGTVTLRESLMESLPWSLRYRHAIETCEWLSAIARCNTVHTATYSTVLRG